VEQHGKPGDRQPSERELATRYRHRQADVMTAVLAEAGLVSAGATIEDVLAVPDDQRKAALKAAGVLAADGTVDPSHFSGKGNRT